jgi:hypothetical protein
MRYTRLLLPLVLFTFSTPVVTAQNFAPAVAYDTLGVRPLSVAVADVNGDGVPDLVVANLCVDSNCANGTVSVLLGNGDGSFKTAVTYNSGGFSGFFATSVVVADVNGDGNPDLLVSNACATALDCGSIINGVPASNGVVGVLLGNGNGTFKTAVTYNTGGLIAFSIAVGDVNGDGKPDLLVANLCPVDSCYPQTDGSVGVLLNNGDGTFQTAVNYDSGGRAPLSVAVADVNGDGKADLVVANCGPGSGCTPDGTIGVLLGNGNGTFKTAVTYDSGGNGPRSVAVADVNGDGKPDIVVANENITVSNQQDGGVGVLLNNGDGTFQTAVPYFSGGYEALGVAVGDVNGDGKADIAVANSCISFSNCNNINSTGGLSVLLGNGNGTFQTAVTYGSGGNIASSVAVGDVNGDGKPDLLGANECGNTPNCSGLGTVGVLINTTPSQYKAFVQPPINANGTSVFSVTRGVLPVKFTLTQNNVSTCNLPPATIAVTRTAGGTIGPVAESIYSTPANNDSNFRINPTDCQYIYNLAASRLGVGTYEVEILINGFVVGNAVFALH